MTIPYGTKAAYIAKGWTEDVFKGGIIEAAPILHYSTLSLLPMSEYTKASKSSFL